MNFHPPQQGQTIGDDQADVPRIQVDVLGKFKLFRGETPITEKEWSAAKKPQMLLKSLITRGADNVPIDLITDDLPALFFCGPRRIVPTSKKWRARGSYRLSCGGAFLRGHNRRL
jgi:hypothetical protein